MKVHRFLERIHYNDDVNNSIACLTKLEQHFLKYIPFENLDIINKKATACSLEDIYNKIVIENKGGVCYETNRLFYWALTELGFDVRIIAAEMFPGAELKQQFYHMALIVCLDDNLYLVDVGNGKYFGGPININAKTQHIGEGISYKIANYNDNFLGLYEFKHNAWKCRYAFDLSVKAFGYFKDARWFTECSIKSKFNKKILVSIFKTNYRLTLSGDTLVKTCYKTRSKQKTIIASDALDTVIASFYYNTT
jgi:N-hydroxyarylamine O-acetyltransferase